MEGGFEGVRITDDGSVDWVVRCESGEEEGEEGSVTRYRKIECCPMSTSSQTPHPQSLVSSDSVSHSYPTSPLHSISKGQSKEPLPPTLRFDPDGDSHSCSIGRK